MAERSTRANAPSRPPKSVAAVRHTNRKGVTYFLNRGLTTTGKARYFFAPRLHENPVAEIPAGYSISEGVNGVVSLVKDHV